MHDGSDEACCGTNGGYCGVEWRGTDGAEWIDIHDDACSGTDFFRVSPGCGIEVKTEWGAAYTYNEGSVLVCGYECECRATPGCDTVRYLLQKAMIIDKEVRTHSLPSPPPAPPLALRATATALSY